MATIEKRGDGYRVRVRLKGEEERSDTFKRKTDAVLWGKKVESDLGHGVYVPTAADRQRTLTGLIDKYIAERLRVPYDADAKKLVAHLEWWKSFAGHLTLDKLQRPQSIASYRNELRKRQGRGGEPVTESTINRYQSSLSRVCKWAWKELGWLQSNPMLSVKKGPEHTGIIRYLTDDERNDLFAACKASTNHNIYCAVALAIGSGQRAGPIRNLMWDDVDFENKRVCFRHVKNNEPRYVPLVGIALRALQEQFDRDPTGKGWVFKGWRDDAPGDLDGPWRAVRAAAGLTGAKHARFHDLRHSTASYLTMAGASLAEVAEALGQRTLVMAKRYSHQSGEHVRSTFERMADRFADDDK